MNRLSSADNNFQGRKVRALLVAMQMALFAFTAAGAQDSPGISPTKNSPAPPVIKQDGSVKPPDDSAEYPPKDTLEASILRGDIAFQNYCVLCHGMNADGRGRAARIYTPKPANLRLSTKNDLYKEMIIRRGGKAMGRSEFMPPWGEELTDEQVADLVNYLRFIAPADAPK